MLLPFYCNAQYAEPRPWQKPKLIAAGMFTFTGYIFGGPLLITQHRVDKVIPAAYIGVGVGFGISGVIDLVRNKRVRNHKSKTHENH